MDWHDFEAWCLADYDKAATTVMEHMRRLRLLQGWGLDVGVFLGGPDEALRQGRAVLAARRAGRHPAGPRTPASGHAMRNAQRVLNWLADYGAARQGGKWPRWELSREPRPNRVRLDPAQVVAARAYRCKPEFVSRRRRAMLWLMLATGLRRSEVARVRVQDVDLLRCRLFVAFPVKGGAPRWVPLPLEAKHPRRPFMAYLRARELVGSGDQDALWLVRPRHGSWQAMTVAGFSAECATVSRELGFSVGSTVMRRTRARDLLVRRGVPVQAVQAAYDHASPAMTQQYAGGMDWQEQAAALRKAGGPGY